MSAQSCDAAALAAVTLDRQEAAVARPLEGPDVTTGGPIPSARSPAADLRPMTGRAGMRTGHSAARERPGASRLGLITVVGRVTVLIVIGAASPDEPPA